MSARRALSWPRIAAIVVTTVGLLAAVAVASAASMSSSEAAQLLGWAVATALVGAVVLAVLLRYLRSHALALQIAALTTTTVVIVAVGAGLGAQAMFLSSHDLSALTVLLIASGTLACVVALLLGDRLARDGEALIAATRRIGSSESGRVEATSASSAELSRVAEELDRTAARLAEARLREQQLERSRRELVAWVSHDLRTPLAGIRAIAEALEDGIAADRSTRDRYYELLRVETEQLSQLIDDLFELSRVQAGVMEFELEQLSLGDLVSDAIAGVQPIAAADGVTVEGHLEGSPPRLMGSAPELLRALRNVLENAVRHTPADGTVVVTAGRRGPDAVVSVLDHGGGVPDDELARIFEVGFRGDTARTPRTGAGLGLAIARSFVEAHRGHIVVRNEEEGARFTIHLPLEPGRPDPASAPAAS